MDSNNEFWLKEAQRVAKLGLYVYDIKKDIFRSSEILDEIFGIDETYPRTLQGWIHLVKDDFKKDMSDYLKHIFTTGEDFDKEYEIIRQNDHSSRWVMGRGKLYYDENGVLQKMVGTIQDITHIKESEEKYKNLYSLLKSLINSIPDLIFYKSVDSVYLGCNKAFEAFAGMEEQKLSGLTDFEIFDQETASFFRKMDLEMIKQGESRSNEEWVDYPDGKRVLLDTLKTPYYDENGHILGLIGISRDITERKKREDKIKFLSYNDILTGLYNRRFLEEKILQLDSEENYPISVMMGDVNGLKLVNDALGHFEGDKLLIRIAHNIRKVCGEKGIVARWGGDEFVVLLPKVSHKEAGMMCKAIVDKSKITNGNIKASISLGFETKNNSSQNLLSVLKKAEANMYKNKLIEANSYRYYIIESITTTLYEKDHETEEHAQRLKLYSKKLGQYLGLSDSAISELEALALLHDVGKIAVDEKILNKNGKLTKDEWDKLKKHSEVGYRILKTIPELSNIANYVLSHHERWDGTGYPKGLKELEIPLLSRILAVVDAYDAMTNDRAYRKAMSKEAAIKELVINAGKQFDPNIVRVFVEKVL